MNTLKYLIIGACLVTAQVFSQSLRVANRYYKEYSYEKAISIYKELYEKGNDSKKVIVGIANSYYNNSETALASKWYKKLLDKNVLNDNELFRFAQCERSNGNYKVSDSILALVKKESLATLNDKTKFLISEENNKYNRISVRNLAVNTVYSDFGAFIFNDKVYFASSAPKNKEAKKKLYKWNRQPYLNLYTASFYIEPLVGTEKDTILELKDKAILQAPISTEFHESNAVITKDGKTMYFTRMNTTKDGKHSKIGKKNTINLKIFRASYVNGVWANITDLPFNSNNYSVGHPALSPDEKTLYFTSDMPSSLGGTDIFKVAIHSDGTYGAPVNLGASVNTKNKEMFPFVGSDNTLYFSSNGHLGLGLLDVFQVKINNDGTYSEVNNLGFPFNSERDDFAFYVNKSGSKGFFTSNRKHGKGDDDIYSFVIYKEEKKVCNQVIAGVVRNLKTKEPIENVTVSVFDKDGKVIKRFVTDAKGRYKMDSIVCQDAEYVIKVNNNDYKTSVSKRVKMKKDTPSVTNADLFLDPLIQGNQIVINPIYFDSNKFAIRADAAYELEHVVRVMKDHPEIKIRIESHTDSKGKAAYNRLLSDKRAKATRDYIVSRGVDFDRIVSAKGYGEDQLLNHCGNNSKCSEEEHQVNRRSYFYITNNEQTSSID